jgi:hypothetical protein
MPTKFHSKVGGPVMTDKTKIGTYGVGDGPGHKDARHQQRSGMWSLPHEPRRCQAGQVLGFSVPRSGPFTQQEDVISRAGGVRFSMCSEGLSVGPWLCQGIQGAMRPSSVQQEPISPTLNRSGTSYNYTACGFRVCIDTQWERLAQSC